jgi:hypothetical protein
MFVEIISPVYDAPSPAVNVELALADTVANPVNAHGNCFESFLFDCVPLAMSAAVLLLIWMGVGGGWGGG